MKLTLHLNHRCNLRCSYCYTGAKVDRRMDPATMRKAIDFALGHASQGWLLLSFFGGEPLLELELMEAALAYARGRCAERGVRLYTSVATNGTLLDEPRLELLRRNAFSVQVSLDGGREAQDANRRYVNGGSSYETVSENLKRLLQAGVSTWVVSVIDPSNQSYLGDSFERLADLGVPHVTFAPNYQADWNPAARERFETALEDLGNRYLARARAGLDIRLDPLHGKIATHLSPGANERAVCKFGIGDIAVASSGRLYPCERLVREDDDEVVCIGDVDRGLDVKKRDALLAAKRVEDPGCDGCELKSRCSRWCGCSRYETTGDLSKVSPLLCWFEECFIAEADRIGNTLYAEQNPVFLKRFYRASSAPAERA